MSSTTTKNILLSQPKIGSSGESFAELLTHRLVQGENSTTVQVEIPGVDPASVEVKCENNTLLISCSKGQLTVPVEPTTDVSKIKADIQWGMLTLQIPNPEVPQARSIKVSVHEPVAKVESRPPAKSHTTKVTSKEFTTRE
jgi:HSP20 family molecular chaperone IbpA